MTTADDNAICQAIGALNLLRGLEKAAAASVAITRLRADRDQWKVAATLHTQLLAASLGMPSDITQALLTRRLTKLVEGLERFRQGGDRGELLACFAELGRVAS